MENAEKITQLLSRAAHSDGVEPLSEQFVRGLADARLGHRHLTHAVGAEIVGLIAISGEAAELVVDPRFRRRGIGTQLWREANVRQVWAHGNLPAAQGFVRAHGLEEQRRLLVMQLGLTPEPVAREAGSVEFAGGLEFMDYAAAVARWGEKAVDSAWLQANNEAFSWHPEQGGWDLERLRRGRETAWFDAKDVIFLVDPAESFTVAGFHWGKWHGQGRGEVYVIGLADAYRGRGLGVPLLQAGLERMRAKGADEVILYVEADNTPAVRAYEKLGFKISEVHCLYGCR